MNKTGGHNKNPANLSIVQAIEDFTTFLQAYGKGDPDAATALAGLDMIKHVSHSPLVSKIAKDASEHFDHRRYNERKLTWGKESHYKISAAYMGLNNSNAQALFGHLTRSAGGENCVLVTAKELAQQLNMSRQTVSKALEILQENGFIAECCKVKTGSLNGTVFMINPEEYYIGKYSRSSKFTEYVKKSAYPGALDKYKDLRNASRYAINGHSHTTADGDIHFNTTDIVP